MNVKGLTEKKKKVKEGDSEHGGRKIQRVDARVVMPY
jgi:hypothetical protein